MKRSFIDRSREEFPEEERYELDELNPYRFDCDRRSFVHLLGAGIVIAPVVPTTALAQRRGRGRGGRTPGPAERLHLGADGQITVLTGKVEVGQGSRTQILQAAAEELGVAPGALRLVMADSAVVPDDGGTAGSRTTPSTVPSVRKACAAARQFLLKTAATKFQAKLESLSVKDGLVTGLGDRKFDYGELAAMKDAELPREVGEDVSVRPVTEWRVLGTSVPKAQAADLVTGKHRYASDLVRPGMLYGVVLRPPAYGAELTAIDLAPARELGATAVQDGGFVGFAAATREAAARARDAAAKTAKWNLPQDPPSSDRLYADLRANERSGGRGRKSERGNPGEVFEKAGEAHRATYHIAYIQHAPMETRAAVAEWAENKLTVWTGTQQPSRVRGQLAEAFRISRENVRLIVPDTGGGFGGKHTGETAIEAARLARAAGKPVSLQWTREEEFTWAYFRPAGVIDVASILDAQGKLTAWEQINWNSGGSAIDTPYQVPNVRTESKSSEQPLRSGSYRALASTANVFARESHMDDLAAAAGLDPLEFRLRHLTDERLRAVLTAAAERFGWKALWKKNTTPQRTGVGLGCGTEKGSFMATCAQVEVDAQAGTYQVVKVCSAFECGAVQNPANLKAQVEGCVLQGLGAVLHEEIRFAGGKILNPAFSQYRVPRFSDLPEIETVLLNRKDLPSVGGSETPIIGIAPAVANALANAVQVRIRSLPVKNDRLQPA